MIGFSTLLKKELMRFWKVAFQTIAAPVLTSLLYLLIFSNVLSSHVQVYPGISYIQFLIPGLAMMTAMQNAFANTSSSLIQSKITGNIVFMLLPPLSYLEFFGAFLIASMVRGVMVGAGVFIAGFFLVDLPMAHPLWALSFAIIGSALLGAFGLIAGIWAEKFDQLAAFQNFFVMPFTFLAGVFYSIKSLPPFWAGVSHMNPFFYIVDGFRYGFFGASDTAPWLSLSIALASLAVVSGIALGLLKSGYKLRQ
jgi:ABC-2 type transport system permease protein